MAETAAPEVARDVITLADVRALAGASGPCLTLVAPVPNPQERTARLKNGIRSLEKQLAERQLSAAEAQGLLTPLKDLAQEAEAERLWANALVAMSAPGVYRRFWLREALPEVAAAGERFEIRPLLAALAREQRFHLLALSRSRVRLLHATPLGTQETPIHDVSPPKADFSTDTASEKMGEKAREEDRRFLKEVEHRVTAMLQPDSGPLLLAGVDHEVALYRKMNRYPHLLDEAVHGSPEALSSQELHERGWRIVSRRRSEALEKAMTEYRGHNGTSLVSSDGGAIVRAATEGRVAGLFLAARPTSGGRPDDPLNILAIQTVLQGGWAFELPGEEMPAPRPVAALMRF